MDPVPPSKQYLKIGEVARLTRLNPSVLRFWETEFAVLRPLKSRTGQRLYSKGDLELVLWIKQLLYEEKLTIAGAKTRLAKASGRTAVSQEKESDADRKTRIIEEVRKDLVDFRNSL
jgi:DNA-binding transcriptional MerR regulator